MQTAKAKILIVDDEPIKLSIMKEELFQAGYDVEAASNPLEAEPYIEKTFFDVVVTDIRMPGQDGLAFLKDLKKRRADQAVIVITAYGSVDSAVEAIKLGAFDYMQKPFSIEELLLKIDKLLAYENLTSENEALRHQLSLRKENSRIIGQSERIRNVLQRIHAISDTDTSVLIIGESGTGKELAAHTIHETSFRASGPFIPISCAVLPKELVEAELFGYEPGAFTGATKRHIGRFEIAHGGTIFLDDVDDIPLDIQVKLLRFLQEHTFERVGGNKSIRINARVIAATKKSLDVLVADKRFREDLFYRLNVVPLNMPPLRDMKEDIPLLADYILKRLAVRFNRGTITLSHKALVKLQEYHWPGNIREFEHVLERMIALSRKDELDENDVPELNPLSDTSHPIRYSLTGVKTLELEKVLAHTEEHLIRWALDASQGNLADAAKILTIPRSTLQYKMKKLIESPADD